MASNALDDLESELTCSICTEVLYHPLTLLDCLHTFCGACVKRWFVATSSSSHQRHHAGHTCPACRATVRGTRPNATVTTLLDMFLKARPEKARSDADKDELGKVYRPGDNVFPPLGGDRGRYRRRTQADGTANRDDRHNRPSLQPPHPSLTPPSRGREVPATNSTTRQTPRPRSRQSGTETRSRSGTQRPDRYPDNTANSSTYSRSGPLRSRPARSGQSAGRTASDGNPNQSPESGIRQVEHQSSLRSLLSVSEFDSQEMEAEIMRQIAEEGLLDGIDITNLNEDQEDEITEMIAQAYRRRQREERMRQRRAPEEGPDLSSGFVPQVLHDEEPLNSHPSRVVLSSPIPPLPSLLQEGPPAGFIEPDVPVVSPPRPSALPLSSLLSVPNVAAANESFGSGRSASEGRQRSGTDVQSRRERLSVHSTNDIARAATSLPHQFNGQLPDPSRPVENSTREQGVVFAQPSAQRATAGSVDLFPRRDFASSQIDQEFLHSPLVPRPLNPVHAARLDSSPKQHSHRHSHSHQPIEPSVSCTRCSKPQIQYTIHYNCDICHEGNYNLCIACFRTGKDTLHWFGAEKPRLEPRTRRGSNSQHINPTIRPAPPTSVPHPFEARRYVRLNRDFDSSPRSPSAPAEFRAHQDPPSRIERGVFCDGCSKLANNCYWKCDTCNDGSWGFCNECVLQARHCTHPLTPLNVVSSRISATLHGNDDNPVLRPYSVVYAQDNYDRNTVPSFGKPASSLPRMTIGKLQFQILSFDYQCAACKVKIDPSTSRMHCPDCDGGQYQICKPCYSRLTSSGQISERFGGSGWRMCPNTPTRHRMDIVAFTSVVVRGDMPEPPNSTERRVVVKQVVGGWSLCDKRFHSLEKTQPTDKVHDSSRTQEKQWRWRESDGTLVTRSMNVLSAEIAFGEMDSTALAPLGREIQADTACNGIVDDLRSTVQMKALWGWFPEDDPKSANELMFPKGAVISEVRKINSDWFWGCYARKAGLFPGNHCRLSKASD